MPASRPAQTLPLALVILLGALTAFGPLAIDMYLPAFPKMTQDLGAAPGAIETTLAAFLLSMGVCQLFYGPLSDRLGRRGPLIAGCLLYCLGAVGCAMARSLEWLFIARLLQGLGGAAGVVIARACVRDRLDEAASARVFSQLILVMGVAPIVAPWLGGQVLHFGSWRMIFVLLAGFGGACLLAVWGWMPETLPPSRRIRSGQTLATFGHLLRDRRFLSQVTAGGLNSGVLFAYIAGSPFVFMKYYDLSVHHYTLLFGVNSLGIIGAAQLNQWLLRFRSPRQLLHLAFLSNAVFGVVLFLQGWSGFGRFPLLVGLLFLTLSGVGVVFPNLAAATLAPHKTHAGSASALLGAMQLLVGGAAGLLVGVLNTGTPLAQTGVIGGAAVLGWLVLRLGGR